MVDAAVCRHTSLKADKQLLLLHLLFLLLLLHLLFLLLLPSLLLHLCYHSCHVSVFVYPQAHVQLTKGMQHLMIPDTQYRATASGACA